MSADLDTDVLARMLENAEDPRTADRIAEILDGNYWSNSAIG
jgi:hypothetical protein